MRLPLGETALGSSGRRFEARPSRASGTETWSLEVSDDLAVDFRSIDGFYPAIFEGLVPPLCLSCPDLLDFLGRKLVETLDEFLGQLGALIEWEIEHLLCEFVEEFHGTIVPVA
jgi:hypothetical protein